MIAKSHNCLLTRSISIVVIFLLIGRAIAQTFTNLHSFSGGDDGAYPYAGLISSGNIIYGVTSSGGNSGNGMIFSINTNGMGFKVLHSFTATSTPNQTNYDGANPYGSLTLLDGVLYGTAANGGNAGKGTVFKLNTNGTGFTTLRVFNGLGGDGANPVAGLVSSGYVLYGTTEYGGTSGNGTIFSIIGDGSISTIMHSFNGSDGAFPLGGLVSSGSALYGTTATTVFKINLDGTGFTTIHTFTGNEERFPVGGLILVGNILYGTTSSGGSSGAGAVFKINADGTGFSQIKTFYYDGANPKCNLVLSGNTLYGTAISGGNGNSSGYGTVFKVNIDGTAFTNIYSFTGASDGGHPDSGLILLGGTLFGTASDHGNSGFGTVFTVNLDGSGFSTIHSFSGGDGGSPLSGLISSGNTMYGTTGAGGVSDGGTVFSANTDGSGFRILYKFNGNYFGNGISNGAAPVGNLSFSGGSLFGTTKHGGNSDLGTVFKINADGTGFMNLHNFTGNGSDGTYPYAGVVSSSNILYGTTFQGGSAGFGIVFKINTDGTGYSIIHNFTGGDGAYPSANLYLSGNTLYGTTSSGGSAGNGTVFSLNTDGTGYSTLHSFSATSVFPPYSNTDGARPYANVILIGNTLYGTASAGGSLSGGTVFKLNTDGTGFLTLHNFTYSDGTSSQAGLILIGYALYGTTTSGGSFSGGTVYKIYTDGTGFTNLYSFSRTDGYASYGNLLFLANELFGTTYYGGSGSYGAMFGLALNFQTPEIIYPPTNAIAAYGVADFSVGALGVQPLQYQWLSNGVPISGATQSNFRKQITSVADLNATYQVQIANIYGAVVSSNVAIIIQNPGLLLANPNFWPGIPTTITIAARPLPGTSFYDVEQQLPPLSMTALVPVAFNSDGFPIAYQYGITNATWQVSNISDGGVYDSSSGKVKWLGWFDNLPRNLTFTIVPPLGNSNPISFTTGNGTIISEDGVDEPIYVSALQISNQHPADNLGVPDWRMKFEEVTAYGKIYANGNLLSSVPPNPVPISYFTRAAYLWKNGSGGYYTNTLVGSAPLWWETNTAQANAAKIVSAYPLTSTQNIGRASRSMPTNYQASVGFVVNISVTPATNTVVYAVEESVPTGCSATAISAGGVIDQYNNIIKWGPNFSNQTNLLSYTLTTTTNPYIVFNGGVSSDGSAIQTGGQQFTLKQGTSISPYNFNFLQFSSGQGMSLGFTGPIGATVILESTTNLINWKSISTQSVSAQSTILNDVMVTNVPKKFYRLRIQ